MLIQEEKNAIVLEFMTGQEVDGSLTKTASRLNEGNPWEIKEFTVEETPGEVSILADGVIVFKVVTQQ